MTVHQHDSIWIEKVGEYMVDQLNRQKDRHWQHKYITMVGSLSFLVPIGPGKQEG
jgi:hypothetical protein